VAFVKEGFVIVVLEREAAPVPIHALRVYGEFPPAGVAVSVIGVPEQVDGDAGAMVAVGGVKAVIG